MCAPTPGLSAGYGAEGVCRVPMSTSVPPAFPFRRSPSLCLSTAVGLIYSPAQRPQIFCAPVYPPEIMVRVRMGAYVADIDALLIHHWHDS